MESRGVEISEIPEISFPLAGNVGALSTARLPPGAPRLPGISTPVTVEISGNYYSWQITR